MRDIRIVFEKRDDCFNEPYDFSAIVIRKKIKKIYMFDKNGFLKQTDWHKSILQQMNNNGMLALCDVAIVENLRSE